MACDHGSAVRATAIVAAGLNPPDLAVSKGRQDHHGRGWGRRESHDAGRRVKQDGYSAAVHAAKLSAVGCREIEAGSHPVKRRSDGAGRRRPQIPRAHELQHLRAAYSNTSSDHEVAEEGMKPSLNARMPAELLLSAVRIQATGHCRRAQTARSDALQIEARRIDDGMPALDK